MRRLFTIQKLISFMGVAIFVGVFVVYVLPYITATVPECEEWEVRTHIVLLPGIGGALTPSLRPYNYCIKRKPHSP